LGAFVLLEILLILFLIIILISVFLIIGIKNKQQSIQTFSIPLFIKSYSNLIDKEDNEEDKSFIEKIKDYFDSNDNSDYNEGGFEDINKIDDDDGE
jgi:hypothetical protein